MAYGAPPSAFSDAELNGLVDSQLDTMRQAEVTERLKSYAAERARVAAWREQNDLLKASFSEVENEPIPLSLSLTPPPRLKCITSDSWSGPRPAAIVAPQASSGTAPRSWRGILTFGVLACFVGAVGCWLIAEHAASVELPLVLTATGRPDGLLVTPGFEGFDNAPREKGAGPGTSRTLIRELPTPTIPDLGNAGFSFTGATVQVTGPTALVFAYENTAGEHLVLRASKLPGAARIDAALAAADDHVMWRRRGVAYALSGTPPLHRLNAIARALQADEDAADGPD